MCHNLIGVFLHSRDYLRLLPREVLPLLRDEELLLLREVVAELLLDEDLLLLTLLREELLRLEELLLLRTLLLDLFEFLLLETELLLLLELERPDSVVLTREEELLRPEEALPRMVVALRLFESEPSRGTFLSPLWLPTVVPVTRPPSVPLLGRPEVVTVVPGRVDDAPPALPTAPPLPAELLAPGTCNEPRSVVRPPRRSL